MTKYRNRYTLTCLAAGWLAACSSAGGTPSDAAPLDPSAAAADSVAAAGAAAPVSGAAQASDTGAAQANDNGAAVGASAATGSAMAPAAAMTAAASGAAATPETATDTATQAMAQAPATATDTSLDTCEDRRVSYSKPCHNDPDPCGIHSGWPGDEYCLQPPPEGEGIQIHIGPNDYADMAEVGKYVIQAGEEFNNSVAAPIELTEKKWFQRMQVQMRPGSHHWISTVVEGKPEPKFYSDTGCGGAVGIGSLGGGQNLIYDNPPGGVPAPENEGLGRSVEGNSSLCMNLHAYNFTDREQLREIWINIYFIAEEKVTQKAQGIGMVGGLGLNLGPHQKKELTYSGNFGADGRIIQLFGHRHAWTPRFAVWLHDELVYDSWAWEESVTFNYDSLSTNPPINTAAKQDGAVSGILEFKAGDELKFTCFIENDSDNTLGFSNQVYEGEMCNLWGSAVGAGLSGTFF